MTKFCARLWTPGPSRGRSRLSASAGALGTHSQRQSSHVINSQLRWGLRSKNSRPELTASGARDLAPKKSVIPFIMEVHHAFLLRRMAAHFDGAI
jgi:hypothetical protein